MKEACYQFKIHHNGKGNGKLLNETRAFLRAKTDCIFYQKEDEVTAGFMPYDLQKLVYFIYSVDKMSKILRGCTIGIHVN